MLLRLLVVLVLVVLFVVLWCLGHLLYVVFLVRSFLQHFERSACGGSYGRLLVLRSLHYRPPHLLVRLFTQPVLSLLSLSQQQPYQLHTVQPHCLVCGVEEREEVGEEVVEVEGAEVWSGESGGE